MIVGIKDVFKLIGIAVVAFCAVFVCTLFLNFYLDARALNVDATDVNTLALYKAQLSTAKFTSAISGGFLAVIALVMLVFYIKLYIDGHAYQLGLLKAMGYSDGKIAMRFFVFGLSVFVGAALGYGIGYASMPVIYKGLAVEGLPAVRIRFHASLLFLLVVLPTAVFSGSACLYAYFSLRRPVSEMLRGTGERKSRVPKATEEKERGFLADVCVKTLRSKKMLVFFVTFSCFCFSAMVQMSFSMHTLTDAETAWLILGIGLVLAATTMLMSVTALINGNSKNIAIMKAFGYSLKECTCAIFLGYVPFAFLGFIVGTVYQYVLLRVMTQFVFDGLVAAYRFNVPIFFGTLAAFIVAYFTVTMLYAVKVNKISVKEIMTEN